MKSMRMLVVTEEVRKEKEWCGQSGHRLRNVAAAFCNTKTVSQVLRK